MRRFTWARAWISGNGMRSVPILKFSSERWVCAPQRRSAGTFTSPMVSVSIRVLAVIVSLPQLFSHPSAQPAPQARSRSHSPPE